MIWNKLLINFIQRENNMKEQIPENLLKVISIGVANHFSRPLLFTERPILVQDKCLYSLKIFHWYFHVPTVLYKKYMEWRLKRKGHCTCECHYKTGFYHCFDRHCCNESHKHFLKENNMFKKIIRNYRIKRLTVLHQQQTYLENYYEHHYPDMSEKERENFYVLIIYAIEKIEKITEKLYR